MGGRRVSLLVIVSIFVAATIALQAVGASAPAQAEGLNFVCSAADEPPGGGPGPGEFEQLRNGLAAALLSGANFFTFQGLAPPGVPVVGGGTTDPVTGGTLFTRTLSPARLGENQNVDFFGSGVPGSSGPELSFGLNLRSTAGQGNDDMGVQRLLNQNFGLPNDTGNDISVVGIDVDVNANSAMAQLPRGFRGSFEAVFAFELADGTDQIGGVRIEFDSLRPGAKIPDVTSLALSFKSPGDPDHTYFAFGQKAQYASFTPTQNQPAVGFGVDMAVIEPGSVERDVLAVKADWTAAPRQVAVGLAQLCPDRGHIAWNMDQPGLPHPETAALDLKFRSGDRLGQTIRVDDGAGGSKTIRADEVVLDAHIDKLPRLMDLIALRDQLTLTHTSEAAPDLTLNEFDMADDDPATPNDRPIHVTGHVGALPRHVLLRVDRNGTAAINRAELTAWTLNCPGEPAPPGLPAPPDVSRNDLVGTLPLFPVGCTRHNLASIPTAEVNAQNWLPEDLDAQAATADLRTAPQGAEQYGFFATRATNPLGNRALWAFGAKVNGTQRATVDLTGAAPGGSKARVYLQRTTNPATNDSARFVVDLDNRTSTDQAANTKARVAADATVTNLPKTLRVDAVSSPGTPLDLTWRADAAFAVTDGSVDAQFAGPSALVVHGAFETGAVGAGSLPPAANVQINGVSAPGGPPGGAVHYGIPFPVTDTFPTPTVPSFPTSAITRIHAGAELTTRADRQAGLGTRLHADLDVPRSIGVSWTTGPDGRLERAFGNLCNPDTPAACAATRFDATAARGPRTPVDRAALLTPPALPTPTGVVGDAVPAFTAFRPGSGTRAVILGPDSWGVDARVTGLSQFSFQRDPLDVAVRLANPEPQPFGVNLLDGSQVTDTGSGPQPQVLFADAALDRLPEDIRIRQQDLDAGPDQPWLWVNTEDVSIGDISQVDFHEDPAGTRPRLTGVLRLGDAQTLRDELPFADRKTPPRDGSKSGVDAWADFDLDHSLLALDTSASVEVPRHVALWRPTLVRCDETVDDVSTCQSRPTYEIDKTETVAVKFKTTSHELGDLNVRGDIHGDGLDWTAAASVEHVPGTFDGGLVLSDNTRLSWIDVDVSFHANAPLGTVRASVIDNDAKAEYRQSADDPEHPGQCQQTDDRCTPNYAIDLANVPADLDVTARIQGSPESRLTPSPGGEPPDPTEPAIDFGGLGFVHANVDLRGTATQLAVQGRIPTDGEFAGTVEAFDGHDVPTPVSGFLNVRVDHVTVKLDSPEGERHPFEEFAIDGGGIVGNLTGLVTDYGPDIGRPFQALTFPLDALIGGLLSLLFGGPVHTRFDMDFDLPLLVAFDKADIVRVGMSGSTLSVDEHHSGEGDPATIATRQQSLPSEADLTADGAFFHHRDVSFVHDALFEGFDVHNSTEDSLQDVGIFRHEQCRTQDEDHVCYFLARNEVSLDQVAAAHPRTEAFSSGDAFLDIFFTADNRHTLDDENTGVVEPGVIFYKKVAERTPPVGAGAFVLPDLTATPVSPSGATFGVRAFCCNTVTFAPSAGGDDSPPPAEARDFGAVCDIFTPDEVINGPRAVGPDGSQYVVESVGSNAVPREADRSLCGATRWVLEAHYPADPAQPHQVTGPLGDVRWSVALPTPDGLEPGGECYHEDVRCDVTTTVTPQVDGSVQVETVTVEVDGGVDGTSLDEEVSSGAPPEGDGSLSTGIELCCPAPVTRDDGTPTTLGTVRAWVDASGHPGFHRQEATRVDGGGFSAVAVPVPGDGTATLDPCAIAPTFGCAALPEGHTAQWLFGDGAATAAIGGPLGPQTHRYPRTPGTDPYLGILVHYDENHEVVDKAYFTAAT